MPESAGAAPVRRVRWLGVTADAILAALLAAGLAAVVFVGKGGIDLGPNTWIQIALVVLAAGCGLAIVLHGPVRPARALGAALVLFVGLAALSYASIAWSVQPADAWVEANRTLSYLAVFAAGAALARLAPARWPAVVWALGTVAVIACDYALLTKVFPATLAAG